MRSLLRLFANEVLFKCKTRLKEHVTLHKLLVGLLKMRVYRFYANMLFSHGTSFRLSKTIRMFSNSDLKCSELSVIRFRSSNILAFAATGRGDLETVS